MPAPWEHVPGGDPARLYKRLWGDDEICTSIERAWLYRRGDNVICGSWAASDV